MEKNPTWIPVVALALQETGGRWLMHLRSEEKQHGGLWEFPGGKLELGETPTNGLIREITEELGIILESAALEPAGFAQSEVEDAKATIVILLYTTRQWDLGLPVQPKALEGGAVGWFTSSEIELLAKPPLDVVLARQLFGQPM